MDVLGQSADKDKHPLFQDGVNHSLGINSQIAWEGLFDQNISTPLELMFRKRAKRNQAYRARLAGMTWYSQSRQTDESMDSRETSLAVSLGYEWHERIGREFGFFYGVEFEKGISLNKSTLNRVTFDTPIGDLKSRLVTNIRDNGFGLLPLVGITYHIYDNFYLTTEVKLHLRYNLSTLNANWYETPNDNPGEYTLGSYSKLSENQLQLYFTPFANIFIHFKF